MPRLTDPENVDDLEWCRAFIAKARWQEAKADGHGKWPHSYTVREWCAKAGFEADWEWFFHLINVYGTAKNFYRHRRVYLVVDDHEYWTMGAPVGESWIINRSPEVGKTHGRQEVHPTQTDRPMSFYDHVAEVYDAHYTEPHHREENRQLRGWLEPMLTESGRVLDLGSGTGLFLDLFPDFRPALYTGLDPSQGMCNAAILKHQKATFLPFTLTEWADRYVASNFGLVTALFSAQYLTVSEINRLPGLLSSTGRMLLVFNKADYLPHYYVQMQEKDPDVMLRHEWWVDRQVRLEAAFALAGTEVHEWGNYWVVRTP